ncbi:MAG: gliding motility-associated C-terminal domain-containing protein [Bacteroidetes bacterium]|nr:gliding motility-associated C-terminal domain-containing protein [Bacteroidota bacterium]
MPDSATVMAEGTKQIMPTSTSWGRLEVYPGFSPFASYNCPVDHRLNIHVNSTTEKIYFGFGRILYYDLSQVTTTTFRIRDPNGNIVMGPLSIPTSGAGFIQNHAQAVIGPSTISGGGYTPLSYTPLLTGDYYIEFDDPGFTSSERIEFEFFDITVASSSNQAIDGRIWSKAWQLTVVSSGSPDPYLHEFEGTMFVYTDDGIVTSCDFNNMRPFVFLLSCNQTGCTNTGNFIEDRKSIEDPSCQYTYPQYKIFLNDPDPVCFPSGVIGSITAPGTLTGCPPNDFCINVEVNSTGSAEVLIDLNGTPGYQPGSSDVLLSQTVNAGTNCIPWDGLNGLGGPVPNGTPIVCEVSYINGLTHLPLNDVEYNPNGFIVTIIRPTAPIPKPALFWDDSNLAGFTNPPPGGCVDPTGCHEFLDMFGNARTINTWWYASGDVHDTFTFVFDPIIITNIVHADVTCNGLTNGNITVTAAGGIPAYSYSLNGGPTQPSNTFSNLGAGTYTVTAFDQNGCSVSSTLQITAPPALTANLTSTDAICTAHNGTATVTPTNGTPPFNYLWNTTPAQTTQTATGLAPGTYSVSVSNASACQLFTVTVGNIVTPITSTLLTWPDTCNSGRGKATVTPTNGTPAYSYTWNTSPQQTTPTASGLHPGSYTVSITDANGCTGTKTGTISNYNPTTTIDLGSIPDTCNGGFGDAAVLNATGNGYPPYNYIWSTSPPQTGTNISGLLPGTYTVSLTDSYGCTAQQSVTVSNYNATVSATTVVESDTCMSSSGDAAISGIAGDGTPPYSIVWNTTPPQTGNGISDLLSGNYSVSITDIHGCSTTVSVQVPNFVSVITPTITTISDTCGFGAGKAMITSVAGSGTPPYSYLWSTSPQQTGNTAIGLNAGNYTVSISDLHGCSATVPVQVPNYVPVITAVISTLDDTCGFGAGRATITTVNGDGTAPYSYVWGSIPQQTGTIATNLNAGSFDVTVTDYHGCQGTETFTIDDYIAPVLPVLSSTDDTCTAGTGKAWVVSIGGEGTAPYSYAWSTTPVQTNPTAINLLTGQYTVTVSDYHGCTGTANTFVGQITYPIFAAMSATNDTCGYHIGTATAIPSGGILPYSWSWNCAPVQTTQTATQLTDSMYSVIVTDAYGCTGIDSVHVLNIYPPIQFTTDIVSDTCNNHLGSISVSPYSGTPPYIYAWGHTGVNAPFTGNLDEGDYYLVITDQNECHDTNTIHVDNFVPGIIDSIIISPDTCTASIGWALLLTDSLTPGYVYEWQDQGGNTISVTELAEHLVSGDYTIQVTDIYGCTASQGITISLVTYPIIISSQIVNPDTCMAGVGRISASPSGGYDPYSLIWSTNPIQTADTAVGISEGDMPQVVITDFYGCMDSATTTMTGFTTDIIDSIPLINDTCISSTGAAVVITDQTTWDYHYYWISLPSGDTISIDSTISSVNSGVYIISVIDHYGCTGVDTINIPLVSSDIVLTISEINPDTCDFGIGRGYVLAEDGFEPYSYSWNTQPPQQNDTVTGMHDSDTAWVVVTDRYGCADSSNFSPGGFSTSIIQMVYSGNDTCHAGVGVVYINPDHLTSGYQYIWRVIPSGDTIGTDSIVTGLGEGTYIIEVSDQYGCNSTDTLTIVNIPSGLSSLSYITNPDTCNSSSGRAGVIPTSGFSPYLVVWQTSPPDTTVVAEHLTAGSTYYYVIKDKYGCSTTDSVVMEGYSPTLDYTVTAGIDSCNRGEAAVWLYFEGGTEPWTVSWSQGPYSSSDVYENLTSGFYVFEFVDSHGCSDTGSVFIPAVCGIEIPNIFTPNGDGYNDFFGIRNIEYYPHCTMTIFNRWGNLIVSIRDYGRARFWEGRTMSGELVPDGTYYYIFAMPDGTEFTGVVMVVRD